MRASARMCIVLVTGLLASCPISLRLADALPDREPQLDQATPQRGERAALGGLQGVALPGRYVWLGEKWEDRQRTGALPIESVAVAGQQLLDLGVRGAVRGVRIDVTLPFVRGSHFR
jgi:hypothetical protein